MQPVRGNLHSKHAEGFGATAHQAAPGYAVHCWRVSQAPQAAPAAAGAGVRGGPQLHRLLFGTCEQDPAGGAPLHAADGLLVEKGDVSSRLCRSMVTSLKLQFIIEIIATWTPPSGL